MGLTKSEVRIAALTLDPAEREELAEELLLSVTNSQRDAIAAAWLAEARRRDASYRSGLTLSRPVGDVIARLQAKARQ